MRRAGLSILVVLAAAQVARAGGTAVWPGNGDADTHYLFHLGDPTTSPDPSTAPVRLGDLPQAGTPCILQANGGLGKPTCSSLTGFSATAPLLLTGSTLTLTLTDGTLGVNANALRRSAIAGDVNIALGSNTSILRTGTANSVLGHAGGASGPIVDLASTTANDVFWNNAGTIGWSPYPYSALTGAPSSLPPSGAAAGDLGSTYPAPTVLAAEFGAQRLTFATTADGALLKRSGSTVIGAVAGTDFATTLRTDGIATGSVQMASLASANLIEGAIDWDDSVGDFFKLVPGTLTTTATTVVTASGKAGYQWHRVGTQNVAWQQQATWSVDPQGTCSDENTGIDDAHPLCTMAELARRVNGAVYPSGGGVVVRLLSNMGTNDTAFFNVKGTGTPGPLIPPFTFVHSFFVVAGVPTTVYSGTISSPSQASLGSTADNHFTDTGAPAFTRANGRLWKRTNGTAAYFWPAKDLGGGTFRISQPATNFSQATLAGGDSWSILQLPTAHDITFPQTRDQSQYAMSEVYYSAGLSATGIPTFEVWSACQFPTTTLPLVVGAMDNDSDFGHVQTNQILGPNWVSGGLQTFNLEIPEGTSVDYAPNGGLYATFQGPGGSPTGRGVVFIDRASVMLDGQIMFYDWADNLIETGNSTLTAMQPHASFTAIGGSGNTAKVLSVASTTGTIVYSTAPPSGMSSDASPISMDGTSFALSALPVADVNTASFIGPRHLAPALTTAGLAQTNASGMLSPITSLVGCTLSGSTLSCPGTGLVDPGANGILVRTALNTTTARTLTNGDGTINFSNPDGVAGNPEIHVNVIPESKVTNLVTDLAALVPKTRTLTITAPGTIDGVASADLSTNRTIAFPNFAGSTAGLVPPSGGSSTTFLNGAGSFTTPAGTVYTATPPIVVTGSVISCPTCGTSSGSVTGVFGTAGQVAVSPSTPNPIVSLVAKGAGAGSYGGNGIAGFDLDAFGAVMSVTPATYLTSTGTTPGTYNNLTVASTGLIVGNSNTSWVSTIGAVLLSGGLSAVPTGGTGLTFASGNLSVANSVKLGGLAVNSMLFTDGSGFAATDGSFLTYNASTHTEGVWKLNVSSTTTLGDLQTFGAVTWSGYAGTGGYLTVDSVGFQTVQPFSSTQFDVQHFYVDNFNGLSTTTWMVPGPTSAGTGLAQQSSAVPPETREPFPVTHVRLLVHNLGSPSISGCNTTFAISKNGTAIGTTALAVTSGTANNTFQDSGILPVSASSTDSFGVILSSAPSSGSVCNFGVYATAYLYAN